VQFVDSPDDNQLAELYSSADVFVFPSRYEGFGLPPLESIACGTPVVTTNCLGVREYTLNEVNALSVPIGDLAGLSEAIVRVLNDESLAETLKKEGLKTAKHYTWDKVVERVEGAFLEALKNGTEC